MTIQEFLPEPKLPTWTDERVDELKRRRFGLKESCGFIARAMGVTRSAITGKINRLGLSEPRPEKATAPRPLVSLRPITSAGRERKTRVSKRARDDGPAYIGPEATEIVSEFVPPNPVTLVQLEPCHCRWPIESPGAVLYCGEIPKDERPYCPAHCLVAYKPQRGPKPWVPGRVET